MEGRKRSLPLHKRTVKRCFSRVSDSMVDSHKVSPSERVLCNSEGAANFEINDVIVALRVLERELSQLIANAKTTIEGFEKKMAEVSIAIKVQEQLLEGVSRLHRIDLPLSYLLVKRLEEFAQEMKNRPTIFSSTQHLTGCKPTRLAISLTGYRHTIEKFETPKFADPLTPIPLGDRPTGLDHSSAEDAGLTRTCVVSCPIDRPIDLDYTNAEDAGLTRTCVVSCPSLQPYSISEQQTTLMSEEEFYCQFGPKVTDMSAIAEDNDGWEVVSNEDE